MYSRRLIAAPAVALVAALLVGAIIDSGQRARMARAAGPTLQIAVPADPELAAEARRVRQAATAATRCTGAAACTSEVTQARVRDAARDISAWPSDPRFMAVRATLRTQLRAQALLIEQHAVDDVLGRASYEARARRRTLERQLDEATLDAARAQRSAGLMNRVAFDALVAELT